MAASARAIAALIENGDYRGAERAARQHADVVRRARGPESIESATATDLLVSALVANGMGSAGEARDLATRALKLREDQLGTTHPDIVLSLSNLAMVLGESQENDRAVQLLQRALTIQEAGQGSAPLALARTLNLLSLAFERAGRYEEAVRMAERSVGLTGDQPERRAQARSLEVLVRALQAKGDYEQAGGVMARALERRRPVDQSHPEFIETLSLLSFQEFTRGRFEAAHDAAADALALAQRTLRPDHPTTARTLRLLANTTLDLWDIEQARQLLQEALAMAERGLGPNHPDIPGYVNDLANLTLLLGDYEVARGLYERSLGIREVVFGERHESVGTVVYNLALVDASLGDYEQARLEYRRAIGIWEHVYGPDHAFVAQALAAQAEVVRNTGQDAEALLLLERALAIRERRLGPSHRTVARNLTQIAATCWQLGRGNEARGALARALRIWVELGSPDDREHAEALALMAELRAEQGDLGPAIRTYEQAMSMSERVLGVGHPQVAQARIELARAQARSGQVARALEGVQHAEAVGREHLRLMLRSLSERQALNYAGIRPRGVDVMLSLVGVAPDATASGIDAIIRSRALVLDEVAARQRATAGADATLITALVASRQRFANLVVQGAGAMPRTRYDRLVEAARQEAEQAERKLAAASADFRLERSRAQAGADEVAAALPAGAALVSFVRYQQLRLDARSRPAGPIGGSQKSGETPYYLAFVLRSGQTPVATKLGPADTIESLVSRWRADIAVDVREQSARTGANRASSRDSGAALRARIWDPIAAHLAGARAIFVVTDGALSLVPFAALPASDGFLIENASPIHYLTAERDLVAFMAAPALSTGGMLALGGPAFDVDGVSSDGSSPPGPIGDLRSPTATPQALGTSCGTLQSIRFNDLDGTLQEVQEIASMWPDALGAPDTRVGHRASEPAFKRDAPRYRVLHLATHGFFLDGACLPQSMAAPQTRGVGGLAATAPVQNPLRLSGLALAGANRRAHAKPDEDDGILTAEEVAMLDLHGAEWAVLSACDTGVGAIKAGEGVFGLRRAFQVAGARTVIMSLWSVEDQATRAWMRALYEGRFQKKLSTADAVHQASLTVLRDRRARGLSTHPFFWAAFVAAGDWR